MTVMTRTESKTEQQVLHDLETLQGVWISISGRREAELLFAGRHFTVRFLDGDLYMGTFTLNPGGHPKTMEMHIEEGPANHQGKVARCLYDVAADALRWCATEPGATDRLGGFPAAQDRRYLSLLFRREQPQRKD